MIHCTMEHVLFLVSLCILVGPAPANMLTIYEGCLVKQGKTELPWRGSGIDVTVWVPKISASNQTQENASTRVFILTLYYPENDHFLAMDEIDIYQSYTSVRRLRNNEADRKNATLSDPLGYGWVDFTFSAAEKLLFRRKSSTELLPMDGKILKYIVDGSYVAINCHKPDLGWEIEMNQQVVIPLSTDVITHNFSLFSNDPIIPSITINKKTLHLGWDKETKRLWDVTKIKEEHFDPLPASIQHWFTLTCRDVLNVTCSLQDGQGRVFMTFDKLDTLPASIAVKVDNRAFVYFHRHTESHVTGNRGKISESSDSHSVLGNPEAIKTTWFNFGNNNIVSIVVVSVLSCTVLVLSCSVAALLKFNTKNRRGLYSSLPTVQLNDSL